MRHSILAERLLPAFFAALLLILAIPALACADTAVGSTFAKDGVTYTITSDTTCSVGAQKTSGTAYAASSGSIVIPDSVNGYAVTGVNAYAFSNGKTDGGAAITSISLPAGVTSIGAYAFAQCTSLSQVTFRTGTQLATIDAYAFYYCTSLQSITIPVSTTSIGMYAFANCAGMTSLQFEDPQATEPRLSCGEGVFQMGGTLDASLTSVLLPARLANIPTSMFRAQTALKTVDFAGQTTGYIGPYAFYLCQGLESLTIPELTNTENPVGSNAFRGMNNLSTITFLGDENYGLGMTTFGYVGNVDDVMNGNPATYYSPLKTIVYYGTHASTLNYSDATHYQAIYFYGTKDDAENRTNCLGHVVVRDDATLGQVSALSGKSTEGNDLVYGGSVPALSAGMAWCYPDAGPLDTASTRYDAYLVSGTDLSAGSLQLGPQEASYCAAPIDVECTVVAPNGLTLAEGTDYTLSAVDSQGNAVGLDAIIEQGTYTITATGAGDYSGSISATFTVTPHNLVWTRYSGNALYATTEHMLDTAFTKGNTDTVIIVSTRTLAAGFACAGLAGVRDAAIITTDSDSLDLEARRTLTALAPTSVFLVGIQDSAAATEAIHFMLNDNVGVTNAFTADTQEGMAYRMYSRTKSANYWVTATCAYIACTDDLDGAAMAGRLAYTTKCPVFLVGEDGVLTDEVASAVAAGFTKVQLVGDAAGFQEKISAQLSGSSFAGEVTTLSAADPYALSLDVAQQRLDAGGTVDGVTLVNPEDAASMLCAVATCGHNDSPMILADDSEQGLAAIASFVDPRVYSISTGYLFGTRGMLSTDLCQQLVEQYGVADPEDLAFATVKVTGGIHFTYDGSAHMPTVASVTASDGTVLTYTSSRRTTEYTISYIDNATDAIISHGSVDAGHWTLQVNGLNGYSGAKGVDYVIDPASLSGSTVAVSGSTVYLGKAVEPALTVTWKGTVLQQGVDYTVAYANNTAAGSTATYTVTGIGNFTGTLTGSFKVQQASGWYDIDGSWYYYQSGKALTGWQKISNTYYYLGADGVMRTGWQKLSGSYYYLGTNGKMVTGWAKVGSVWYYFATSGAMQTGWVKISSKYYYFKANGAMVTGWQKIGSAWYHFTTGGVMQTGWVKLSGKYYYFKASGAMVTGWQKISGKWYWFNTSGAMATGKVKISGVYRTFSASGVWTGK